MLRRSSFKRPKYDPPKVPVTPSTTGWRAVIKPVGEIVQAAPKDEPVRSLAYRQYVASLPCFGCGVEGRSQAAHSNSPIHGKGKGLKADDRFLFPLCTVFGFRVGCHEQHDQLLDMSRDQRRELEEQYVERMHEIARRDGWDLETLRRVNASR
jgi:hypothetical protein